MNLFQAINASQEARTTNGCLAHATTGSDVLDFFYKIGSSRGENLVEHFKKAFAEDAHLALSVLLYARDVRGGMGERQHFRDIIRHLSINSDVSAESVNIMRALVKAAAELGRWDDVLVLVGTRFESTAFDAIGAALKAGDGLCAKWMPRQGQVAVTLRKYFDMSPKQWRKTLVSLTNVVETKMCEKRWDEIEFSHVPSVASARYQTAFGRNATEAYTSYLEKLTKGDKSVKVNASAIFPHDVIAGMRSNVNKQLGDAQWAALPNYFEGMDSSGILTVCDVSGSMFTPVSSNSKVQIVDVATALTMYCAERMQGNFKNKFITFSTNPTLQELKGATLDERLHNLHRAAWSMSTNIEAVFELILSSAKKWNLPQSEMPTKILIVSDMQFNCIQKGDDTTVYAHARKKWAEAGYVLPTLVFWGVNSRANSTTPVQINSCGAQLVSGFSPAVLTGILNGGNVSPLETMKDIVGGDRHNIFTYM